jgi:hypothetical protein
METGIDRFDGRLESGNDGTQPRKWWCSYEKCGMVLPNIGFEKLKLFIGEKKEEDWNFKKNKYQRDKNKCLEISS